MSKKEQRIPFALPLIEICRVREISNIYDAILGESLSGVAEPLLQIIEI